jgi:hypothetical protein
MLLAEFAQIHQVYGYDIVVVAVQFGCDLGRFSMETSSLLEQFSTDNSGQSL